MLADICHMPWFASIRMLLRHFPRKVLKLRRPKPVFLEESAESQAKGETVSALACRRGLIPQQLS
jgi:hypothetical protein